MTYWISYDPPAWWRKATCPLQSFALAWASRGCSDVYRTYSKRGYRFAAPVHPLTVISNASVTNCEPNDPWRIAEHCSHQHAAQGYRKPAAIYETCIANEPCSIKARAGLADMLLMRSILGDLSRDEVVCRTTALLAEAQEIDTSATTTWFALEVTLPNQVAMAKS